VGALLLGCTKLAAAPLTQHAGAVEEDLEAAGQSV
jgi:hypothetical protein